VGALSDAKIENYDFTVLLSNALPAPGAAAAPEPANQKPKRGKQPATVAPAATASGAEHVVVVRVYDRAENVATAKVVTK
jgi:hypothetical protein